MSKATSTTPPVSTGTGAPTTTPDHSADIIITIPSKEELINKLEENLDLIKKEPKLCYIEDALRITNIFLEYSPDVKLIGNKDLNDVKNLLQEVFFTTLLAEFTNLDANKLDLNILSKPLQSCCKLFGGLSQQERITKVDGFITKIQALKDSQEKTKMKEFILNFIDLSLKIDNFVIAINKVNNENSNKKEEIKLDLLKDFAEFRITIPVIEGLNLQSEKTFDFSGIILKDLQEKGLYTDIGTFAELTTRLAGEVEKMQEEEKKAPSKVSIPPNPTGAPKTTNPAVSTPGKGGATTLLKGTGSAATSAPLATSVTTTDPINIDENDDKSIEKFKLMDELEKTLESIKTEEKKSSYIKHAIEIIDALLKNNPGMQMQFKDLNDLQKKLARQLLEANLIESLKDVQNLKNLENFDSTDLGEFIALPPVCYELFSAPSQNEIEKKVDGFVNEFPDDIKRAKMKVFLLGNIDLSLKIRNLITAIRKANKNDYNGEEIKLDLLTGFTKAEITIPYFQYSKEKTVDFSQDILIVFKEKGFCKDDVTTFAELTTRVAAEIQAMQEEEKKAPSKVVSTSPVSTGTGPSKLPKGTGSSATSALATTTSTSTTATTTSSVSGKGVPKSTNTAVVAPLKIDTSGNTPFIPSVPTTDKYSKHAKVDPKDKENKKLFNQLKEGLAYLKKGDVQNAIDKLKIFASSGNGNELEVAANYMKSQGVDINKKEIHGFLTRDLQIFINEQLLTASEIVNMIKGNTAQLHHEIFRTDDKSHVNYFRHDHENDCLKLTIPAALNEKTKELLGLKGVTEIDLKKVTPQFKGKSLDDIVKKVEKNLKEHQKTITSPSSGTPGKVGSASTGISSNPATSTPTTGVNLSKPKAKGEVDPGQGDAETHEQDPSYSDPEALVYQQRGSGEEGSYRNGEDVEEELKKQKQKQKEEEERLKKEEEKKKNIPKSEEEKKKKQKEEEERLKKEAELKKLKEEEKKKEEKKQLPVVNLDNIPEEVIQKVSKEIHKEVAKLIESDIQNIAKAFEKVKGLKEITEYPKLKGYIEATLAAIKKPDDIGGWEYKTLEKVIKISSCVGISFSLLGVGLVAARGAAPAIFEPLSKAPGGKAVSDFIGNIAKLCKDNPIVAAVIGLAVFAAMGTAIIFSDRQMTKKDVENAEKCKTHMETGINNQQTNKSSSSII